MRRQTATVFVVAALATAGCGGADDESTSTTAPASTEEGATYDVTVGEFVAALQPDKTTMVADFVKDNPEECKGIEANEVKGLIVPLSVKATEAPPDTPLPEFMLDYCTP